jgi:enterochelin esterase-like enzyme
MKYCLLLFLAAAAIPVPARLIQSPEVAADRRVTFRFQGPNAKEVRLAREGADPLPMQKTPDGLWSVTIGPLEPDFYGYTFLADGVRLMDPENTALEPNLFGPLSQLHVPGPSSLPWETDNIPHGEIHEHFYHSGVVGDDRELFVYTPPGYDPHAKKPYPVLYLLHGLSHDARSWTEIGKAHLIADHLIAQGKMKPMVIVMPSGYGDAEVLARPEHVGRWEQIWLSNTRKFHEALLAEVIPPAEKAYRISRDRKLRALAGLSMGGTETLYSGLNAIDRFAWLGSFSAGTLADDVAPLFPTLNAKANAQLRLLWIACATDDSLIVFNRKFRDWLTSKRICFTPIETLGRHTWMLWRRNLVDFLPLLFTEPRP